MSAIKNIKISLAKADKYRLLEKSYCETVTVELLRHVIAEDLGYTICYQPSDGYVLQFEDINSRDFPYNVPIGFILNEYEANGGVPLTVSDLKLLAI